MKKLFAILCACALLMPAYAQKIKANKDTEAFRYDIECAGNAVQGAYLVKVSSYSRNAKIAAEQCAKNAVHGVIFKGFTGTNGCVSQRPLAANPGVDFEHADFFKEFFSDNGEYRKYVSMTAGSQATEKVGRAHRVSMVATVQKDALRKALEAAGVIKSLNAGF